MDPDACLRRLHEALIDGDLLEAKWASLDLHRWIDRGGFEPNWERYPAAHRFYTTLIESGRADTKCL